MYIKETADYVTMLKYYGFKAMRDFMKKSRIFDTREAQITLISMYEHDYETARKESHNG